MLPPASCCALAMRRSYLLHSWTTTSGFTWVRGRRARMKVRKGAHARGARAHRMKRRGCAAGRRRPAWPPPSAHLRARLGRARRHQRVPLRLWQRPLLPRQRLGRLRAHVGVELALRKRDRLVALALAAVLLWWRGRSGRRRQFRGRRGFAALASGMDWHSRHAGLGSAQRPPTKPQRCAAAGQRVPPPPHRCARRSRRPPHLQGLLPPLVHLVRQRRPHLPHPGDARVQAAARGVWRVDARGRVWWCTRAAWYARCAGADTQAAPM